MKGWKQRNSKKKRNGKGSGGSGDGSKVCLLFECTFEKWIWVLAIDTISSSEGGEPMMSLLPRLDHVGSPWRVGFGSLGSKIYVIGGDTDDTRRTYPKEVYYWDFDEPKQQQQWKKGPPLNGMKPKPVVVTVNKKIYALANISFSRFDFPEQNRGPVFEVLDPEAGNVWLTLPDPPFFNLYKNNYGGSKKFYRGFRVQGHTVIGFNIYVLVKVQSPVFYGNYEFLTTLYSFNVINHKWKVHGDHHVVDSDDDDNVESDDDDDNNVKSDDAAIAPSSSAGSDCLILNNLKLGNWFYGADVVDYLMYQIDVNSPGEGIKVYALDLTANKKDEETYEEEQLDFIDDAEKDEETSEEETSEEEQLDFIDNSSKNKTRYVEVKDTTYDFCFVDHDYLVPVPVLFLNHVTDEIPDGRSDIRGFVIHLRDNMFCLVSCYDEVEGIHVLASVFEVFSVEYSEGSKFLKRILVAENVTHADCILESSCGNFSSRCKIPNNGFQEHFRRPQFQHEGKPNPYQDDVAGKEVRKRNGNAVREVNTQLINFEKLISVR